MALYSFQIHSETCPSCGADLSLPDSVTVGGFVCNVPGDGYVHDTGESTLILHTPSQSTTAQCNACKADLHEELSHEREE